MNVLIKLIVVVSMAGPLWAADDSKGAATRPPLGGREQQIRRAIEEDFAKPPTRQPGKKPVPESLPSLNPDARRPNGPPFQAEVERIWDGNYLFLESLEDYDPVSLCAALEKRMVAEQNVPLKLILATQAAMRGSEAGALYLLDCLKRTDYTVVRNADYALEEALRSCSYPQKRKAPSWLVEMAIGALSDKRYATGLEEAEAHWAAGTVFTLSQVANDAYLTYALADLHCTEALPLLIERAKAGDRYAMASLGTMGDSRAIPALLDFVKEHHSNLKRTDFEDGPFGAAVASLGELHAVEAVPVLRRCLVHAVVVRALEAIGDRSVIPDLEKIVAAGKPEQIRGSNAESDKEAVAAAKIALATLNEGDAVPHYLALFEDKSLGDLDRTEIVWRLHTKPDRRAIPFLFELARATPDGTTAGCVVSSLGEYRFKEAVSALIACFDVKFEEKALGKDNPEHLRQQIADSLQRITGKHLGPDKGEWLKWWNETGQKTFQEPEPAPAAPQGG